MSTQGLDRRQGREDSQEKHTVFELLRTDDTTGKTDVTLSGRTNAASKFGADAYISIRHNAGISGGTGGVIVATWRKRLKKEKSSIGCR